jgi:hypothetical protein
MKTLSQLKRVALGGMLAGSLIVSASPVLAQDFRSDRREILRDERILEREQGQLIRDREILDEHLRYGASRAQIARDYERIREDEAKVRRAEAELRHDRREFAQNYGWNRLSESDRFSQYD